MAPEIAIPCQFMPPETGDLWFQIMGPEISKMVQFLGPETAGIWLFLDRFLKNKFFFTTLAIEYI